MTALTGKALKDRASELEIAGRSKMSADELREAIKERMVTDEQMEHAEEAEVELDDDDELPEMMVLSTPGPSNSIVAHDPELDTFKLVPNRKDRRRAKKLSRRSR